MINIDFDREAGIMGLEKEKSILSPISPILPVPDFAEHLYEQGAENRERIYCPRFCHDFADFAGKGL